MRSSHLLRLGLLMLLATVHPTAADTLAFFDGEFPDTDWSILDDEGNQLSVGQAGIDGNPGNYRRLTITMGGGGQADIVNQSPSFTFDPATQGTLTGLSMSFDVIRFDAGVDPFYLSIGTLQNGDYDQQFSGLAGVGWQHFEFECIDVGGLQLDGGPVTFAFAFSGFTPFAVLNPAVAIGIDNFRVQIQTAPDSCDGFGPAIGIASTDGGHVWNTDPVIPYLLTVTNTGGVALPAVTVSDQVPVNSTFSPAGSSPGWACGASGAADDVCTVALGALAPGESKSVTFAAQVADGTSPAWDVFNEARADGAEVALQAVRGAALGRTTEPEPAASSNASACTATCTSWESDADDGCDHLAGAEALACCALKYACFIPDFPFCEEKCVAYKPSTCSQATTPPSVQSAAADTTSELIQFGLLYRLRDRSFHATAGGERATALYYQHSQALKAAFLADPSLAVLALETLRLWQPAIRALVEGTPDTVTSERLQALVAFLDALRVKAPATLVSAIDHGRRRLELETWENITLAAALDRLDDLVCAPEATYPSVRCRLEDAVEVLLGLPSGTLTGKLGPLLDRATTFAGEAATAAGSGDKRLAKKRLRAVAKLARKVARKAKSKRGKREIPEAARTALAALLGGVPADAKTLTRARPTQSSAN